MMACARAAFAARVEAPARGRHASTRVVAAQNGHVHGTASAASSRAFARLGAKRSARSHVAQAVAVNKATRSIDEMDMDPEHVTFASSDELDARCVRLPFSSRAPEPSPEAAAPARRERTARRGAEDVALDATAGNAASRLAVARLPARRFGRLFRLVASAATPAVRETPRHPRVDEIGSAPPSRRADRARRAARPPRPAHATTRGGSGRGTRAFAHDPAPSPHDRRSPASLLASFLLASFPLVSKTLVAFVVAASHVRSASMDCAGGVCELDIDDITAPVMADMEQMRMNLRDIVGRKNPLSWRRRIRSSARGKRLRPVLVFLVARATAQLEGLEDITDRQRRLAEITEMIHTASLVHDDVLDDCDTRRGAETIHTLYGTRVAILAGDFLFAQSSWYLANLDNLEVIKLISQVIADFADGEISQAGALYNVDITLEEYLEKSHNKTASLIAAVQERRRVQRRVGGHQGGHGRVRQAPRPGVPGGGRHPGLHADGGAASASPRAKTSLPGTSPRPSSSRCAGRMADELKALIQTQFEAEGDERAIAIVNESGIEDARRLAREEADMALSSLKGLPEGEAKASLVAMVEYVLERIY